MGDNRLLSTPTTWWRTLSLSNAKLPVDLSQLFQETDMGVVVNGEFTVSVKYSTNDGSSYKHGDPVTVVLNLVKGDIATVTKRITPPTNIGALSVALSKPTRADVASDELIALLKSLGC